MSTDTGEPAAIAPDAAPAATRQPRKRFVGRKTAETLRQQQADGAGSEGGASIEDASSNLQGVGLTGFELEGRERIWN